VPPHALRDPRALCCHRLRRGKRWEIRRLVSGLVQTAWQECCVHQDVGLSLDDYRQALRHHACAICAEGGGRDPSPKAWEALLAGCIPILRATPPPQPMRICRSPVWRTGPPDASAGTGCGSGPPGSRPLPMNRLCGRRCSKSSRRGIGGERSKAATRDGGMDRLGHDLGGAGMGGVTFDHDRAARSERRRPSKRRAGS
jgi:hypothetical protein